MRKSIDAVAAIFGILKAGAAYVPVDPGAPPARNAYILQNCAVKAVVMESRFDAKLRPELEQLGPLPALLLIDEAGAGAALRRALDEADAKDAAPAVATVTPRRADLAYILYTSGSTGKPKGVMLSHENGVSFVDWCSEVFEPQPRRPLLLARAVPLRPVDPRHPRPAQARRDAGADRRGRRQGPGAPRRADRRAADLGLVLGAVDPRAARAVREARRATTTRPCAWCSSPARSSR